MTATNHTAPHPEPTPRRALVLFAHGARNPEWAEPLRYAQSVLSERLPDHTVTVAFLEFLSPTLTEAVMELAPTHSEIVIVPWFVAEGGHLQRDLPQLVNNLATHYPAVQFSCFPPIGTLEPVIRAIADAVVATLSAS